jgi:ATP-dependent 26S proteasome regulatory subunit
MKIDFLTLYYSTKIDPNIDLEEVVRHIPENFTGADFSALTSEAYMIAVKQKI